MRDIELRLTADLDSATKEVATFRKEYGSLVKAVEKPLRQVNAFRDLEANVEQTGKAMRDARERVRELSGELIKAENPSRQLQETYRAAGRELQRLERVEGTQTAQLAQMSAGLRAAGIDTRNLTREQSRLSAEYGKAMGAGRADSALSNARSALGANAVRDTQIELAKLREQYSLVKASGELSARDLGVAQANYRRSVTATLVKLRELRAVNAAPIKAATPALADTSRQTFGIKQLRDLRTQLAFLNSDYQRLTRSGVLSAEERAVAENRYRQQVEQTRRSIAALSGAQARQVRSGTAAKPSSGLAENVTLAGAGLTVIAASAAYLKATDTAKKMEAQLRLSTSSQQEFNEAQRATFEIAQRNQAPLEGVVTLYAQLAPALAQMGRGQKDTLGVIDAVTQSLRISGATASETASTVLQFSQALGSGVLRGDEFNSIAENSPRLLRALADGLKVPTGALRAMAAEGKLTADVIVDTLLGQLPKLAAEAKNLPETWGGSFEQLKNQMIVTTKQFDDFAGVSNTAIAAVHGFTAALSKLSSGEFGDFFRDTKQSVGGFNNDIAGAMSRMRDLTDARAKLDRNDSTDTVFFNWKFYNKADFDRELKLLSDFVTESQKTRDKLAADQGLSDSQASNAGNARFDAARALSVKLKDLQAKVLEDAKKGLKDQVAAEREATTALKKAKDEQLETQKEYADAAAKFRDGGTEEEASYASAQSLKVSARAALAKGDAEGAKKQARAALDVLNKLSDAGKNTYGFEGFTNELGAIAGAADKINVDKADDNLEAVKAKLADISVAAEKLKELQITAVLSDESRDAAVKQIKDLRVLLDLEFAGTAAIKPTQEMQTISGEGADAVSFPVSANSAPTSQQPQQPVSTVAPTPVAVAPANKKLKYQAGVTDYGQQDLSVSVEPVLEEDYYQKMVREVAERGKIPVELEPTVAEDAAGKIDVPVTSKIDDASLSAAQSQIAVAAEKMRRDMTIPVTVVGADGTVTTTPANTDVPGYAAGDIVRGPGSGTSDSILARLSNGEFVMKAAAVQHYGPDFLRRINERRLPGFAEGGSVGNRFVPDVPVPGQSLMQQINPPAPEPYGHLSISLNGETYNVQAPQQEFDRLIRQQRMKYGRS